MTPPTTAPGLRDRAALTTYLTRLSWAMQDYPAREWRDLRRALRADTLAAAADVGMSRALADLGHPRVLAESYLAQRPGRLPRWTAGTVAAGVTVLVLFYLAATYTFGTLDTLEQLGGGEVTRHPFGRPVTFSATPDALGVSGDVGPLVLLALGAGAVAWLLGARVWRLWTEPR